MSAERGQTGFRVRSDPGATPVRAGSERVRVTLRIDSRLARWSDNCLGLAAVEDDPRHALGKFGEDMACAELERLGYAILARRHRTRYGEIDIVARDGETTVFAEVKTRDGSTYGSGAESVARWKQQRLARMAIDYAARHGLLDTSCRVDVVEIDVAAGKPRIEVYRNAFDVRVT